MKVLVDIISSFLKPTSEQIGQEIATALKQAEDPTDGTYTTEEQLQFRTQEWSTIWKQFIEWQKIHEDRAQILRATQAFSEFEPERLRDLILNGNLKTTGEADRTDKLKKFGLVRQRFGFFLLATTLTLSIIGTVGWFGGFLAAILTKGGDVTFLIFFFAVLCFALLLGINKTWPYRVTLTEFGRIFVSSELLPAMSLFLEQQNQAMIAGTENDVG